MTQQKLQRLEQARNYVFTKGKHKDKTLALVAVEDYKYLERVMHSKEYYGSELLTHIQVLMYSTMFYGGGK
jgi:hypothetical protein